MGSNKRIHEGNKPHSCGICDSRFISLKFLKRHVETIHEYKKSFECLNCDATFSYKTGMKVHIKSRANNHMNVLLAEENFQ